MYPTNTMPFQQFTQQLKAAELANAKEIKLSIQQARLLNIALTELLELNLSELIKNIQTSDTEVVNIQIDGGKF
jgi:hypothetical protein